MAERITEENVTSFLQTKDLTAVDFYRDGCVPCKRMAPVLFRVEEEEKDRIAFGKANIDADPQLAERYGVMAAPTLIFFHKGEEAARFRGVVKEDEIRVAIEKLKNI
ncbi:MAG: thioredoxin family protein [Lachnospiraceae bacterium]|nr:thioredoxin family protein [Lachnospiraceae bacterium]MBQ5430078.1 thioredoxin family protein [Lachnospiraceae bacterium]